ncbi:MAG: diguanylate cyclase [Anaerolineaceae bacterium]|nr:diguanylate cyclase [Anaerolineaceae bacterium]
MELNHINELEHQLAIANGELEQIDALNALAWELTFNDTERASRLAQQALKLSDPKDKPGKSYLKGVGQSLRTLGDIAKLRCDYSTALSNLLEASTILETLPDLENWLIVSDSLGWVYFNLGDIPLAFETIFKALRIARENNNAAQEANILTTLGALYGEIGDKEQSIGTLQRALDYLDGTQNHRRRCISLNNLAMTQFEISAYDEALENAAKSVEIARQLDSAELLATSLDTTGQIYLAKNDFAQAENYFKEAQKYYFGIGNDPDEIMLNLARAAIGLCRFDDAEYLVRNSLETVGKRGANRFKYQFHELLAKIYEAKHDFQNALEEYKLFHSLKAQVYNEDTQRRLANRMVIQEAENTQIDAELYHLKNLNLRKEISIHRRAVAEMEILATTDSLTRLLNRRHLMTLAHYAFDTAHLSGRPLVALMMDIDDFKKVNDNFGHPTGDKVLTEVSATIQSSLRGGDLLGRYGGEEFTAILPETDLLSGQQVAERIVKNVSEHLTQVENHNIQVTLSIGTAQAETADVNLNSLLERADKALYSAKQAGKNCTMTASFGGIT